MTPAKRRFALGVPGDKCPILFSENLPRPGKPYWKWRDRLFAAFRPEEWERAPVRTVRGTMIKSLQKGPLLLEARYSPSTGRCSNLYRFGGHWTRSDNRCRSMAEELNLFEQESGCL